MGMFCQNCGETLKSGIKFCPSCGAQVNAVAEKNEKKPGKSRKPAKVEIDEVKVSENITLCRDGKYRWSYELNLLKNPSIFFLVWRIFFFIFLGIFAMVNIFDAANWDDFFKTRLLENLKFMGYFLVGMTLVVWLGYFIYAAIMGFKYCVDFEMDERGINHKQTPKQAKKAKKLARLTTGAGLARGNLTTAGVGINSARTEMYSEFSKTRKVKLYPKRSLIKVNGLLEHNQVYTRKEDFEFVKNYIITHCSNLKKTQAVLKLMEDLEKGEQSAKKTDG